MPDSESVSGRRGHAPVPRCDRQPAMSSTLGSSEPSAVSKTTAIYYTENNKTFQYNNSLALADFQQHNTSIGCSSYTIGYACKIKWSKWHKIKKISAVKTHVIYVQILQECWISKRVGRILVVSANISSSVHVIKVKVSIILITVQVVKHSIQAPGSDMIPGSTQTVRR